MDPETGHYLQKAPTWDIYQIIDKNDRDRVIYCTTAFHKIILALKLGQSWVCISKNELLS